MKGLFPYRRKERLSAAQHRSWRQNGYVILDHCFGADEMARTRDFVDRMWSERTSTRSPLTIDVFLEPFDPRMTRMPFHSAPEEARDSVYKLNDAYLEHAYIRDIALAKKITDAIIELIEDEPCICNSLIFERGSQQGLHVDTYYMPPPEGSALIVTSVCLEDVHPDAGPVQYVPGSHLLAPYRNPDGGRHVRSAEDQADADRAMRHKLAEFGRKTEPFLGRAGDVLIWHEELVHGGSPIVDMARTRMSLVTHYWGHSAIASDRKMRHNGGYYLRRLQQPVE